MLQHHKPHFVFTLCLILFLMVIPIAQAAPPLQSGSSGDSSLGDSLNLDEDGVPLDQVDGGGNNLGTVMSDKDATDDGMSDDDGITDNDDILDDDGAIGNETTDDGATEEAAKQHPVAAALASYFDVEYEEIMTLHEAGNGFGNIAKAYFFGEKLGVPPQDLLTQAHDSGWGNVLKQNGIHPGAVGGKKDKWGEAEEPEEESVSSSELTGPQNGNGGGRPDFIGPGGGNGHGHGNGNGGGNGGGNGNGHGHGGGNGGGGNGNGGGKGNK